MTERKSGVGSNFVQARSAIEVHPPVSRGDKLKLWLNKVAANIRS